MSPVTIRDIAKIAGVSHTTVSRVINGNRDVNAATKQKILDIMEEYNYIPNDSARNLKLNDTNSIGVFSNNINNPFLSEMVQDIEERLNAHKYSVYLQMLKPAEGLVLSASKLIKEKKLKGVIFVGGYSSFCEEDFDKLNVPIVFTTIKPMVTNPKKWYSSIYIDDKESAFKATDYLCKLGHKRIAIITSGSGKKSIGQDRLEGYIKALEQNQIPVDVALIKRVKDSSDIHSSYQITKELMKENVEFTAVFAVTDIFALGVIRALSDEGIRIPEDVSVLGFDGIKLGDYTVPRLTTIQQPVDEMVEASVNMIIEMIEHGKPGEDKYFDTHLKVGESCREIK